MTDTLIESKQFYYSQLTNTLLPFFYKSFKAKFNVIKKQSSSKIIERFQEELQQISYWDEKTIISETQKVVDHTQSEDLADLITACIYTSTKILLYARSKTKRKLSINIPKLSSFIHNCYKNIARQVWMNPDLFYDIDLTAWEIQKNFNEIKHLIKDSIKKTIEQYIPVKTIIKNYGVDSDSDSDTDSSDDDTDIDVDDTDVEELDNDLDDDIEEVDEETAEEQKQEQEDEEQLYDEDEEQKDVEQLQSHENEITQVDDVKEEEKEYDEETDEQKQDDNVFFSDADD